MSTYNSIFMKNLENLKKEGNYREFYNINRVCGEYPYAKTGENLDKTVSVWCSNDYLGMSQNPDVLKRMHLTLDQYGAGAGGSRNIGGTHLLFYKLEQSLADWHDKQAALVFPTGYTSNTATLQCLLKLLDGCLVFSDEQNHASLINGIKNSRAEKIIFKHNDVDHLEILLKSQPVEKLKVIVFESIYSMDGDISPVSDIILLAKKYNCFTFLDEVHAIGMYGPKGAGIAAKLGVQSDVDIIQGTLAKAVGIIGGYIAGNIGVIDAIRSFAHGFIFTTAMPPAIADGCLTSIEHLKKSNKERDTLHEKTVILRNKLSEFKIPILKKSESHIIPVMIGSSGKCTLAAKRLYEKHNIYLQPINYPSVEKGTERFRVNVTPNHSVADILHLAKSLQEVFSFYDIPFQENL